MEETKQPLRNSWQDYDDDSDSDREIGVQDGRAHVFHKHVIDDIASKKQEPKRLFEVLGDYIRRGVDDTEKEKRATDAAQYFVDEASKVPDKLLPQVLEQYDKLVNEELKCRFPERTKQKKRDSILR